MTSKNGSCDNARPSYADLWKAPTRTLGSQQNSHAAQSVFVLA